MQIVISILQFLVPYLIKFVDKHTDEWLEDLYNIIGKKFSYKSCKLSVRVYGESGNILDNAMIKFNAESIGDIMTCTKNIITLSTPNITVLAEGHKQKELTLNIIDNSLLDIDVVLEKENQIGTN